MKQLFVFFTFLALVALGLSTVRAQKPDDVPGWQEARWGMTEPELVEAFKSRVTKLPERQALKDNQGYADYSIQDYEIEGNKFTVFFDMDMQTKKLMRVRMSLNEETSMLSKDTLYFPKYESLLTRKYGAPSFKNDERSRGMVILEREWFFKTTTVKLSYVWSSMGNFSWLKIMYFASKSGDLDKV